MNCATLISVSIVVIANERGWLRVKLTKNISSATTRLAIFVPKFHLKSPPEASLRRQPVFRLSQENLICEVLQSTPPVLRRAQDKLTTSGVI